MKRVIFSALMLLVIVIGSAQVVAGAPIHEAAQNGDINRVTQELGNGVHVDIVDEYNTTALLWAARYGRLDVVDMLIIRGANVNHANQWGDTALIRAIVYFRTNVAKTLIGHYATNIDQANLTGWTPLMWAVFYGQVDMVKMLVESGADIHATDKRNKTALDIAQAEQSEVAAKMIALIRKGTPSETIKSSRKR